MYCLLAEFTNRVLLFIYLRMLFVIFCVCLQIISTTLNLVIF